MEQLSIPVGELTFDARAAGPADGPLVLLLHGFPQTSWSWRAQLEALGEAGFRAVAPDQRGYSPGARPTDVAAYAMPHLVADVLAIADWLGGHQFHLVGHDWGGAVAWQVAGRHPERLRSLTVVSTPHPGAFRAGLERDDDQREKSGYMLFFQQPYPGPEDAFVGNDCAGLKAVYEGSGMAPADAAEYLRVLGTRDALAGGLNWYRAADVGLIDGMGPVTTPTMYVWSTDDVALGRGPAEATGNYVDGPYRFEVLEGVSHWVPEHAADALNRLLLDHLRAYG
jgi:pimeloyl-ACP methyl ester carboxylesterase